MYGPPAAHKADEDPPEPSRGREKAKRTEALAERNREREMNGALATHSSKAERTEARARRLAGQADREGAPPSKLERQLREEPVVLAPDAQLEPEPEDEPDDSDDE